MCRFAPAAGGRWHRNQGHLPHRRRPSEVRQPVRFCPEVQTSPQEFRDVDCGPTADRDNQIDRAGPDAPPGLFDKSELRVRLKLAYVDNPTGREDPRERRPRSRRGESRVGRDEEYRRCSGGLREPSHGVYGPFAETQPRVSVQRVNTPWSLNNARVSIAERHASSVGSS